MRLARAGGARVSLDLASVGPLLAGGRTAALDLVRSVAPDVLFATATELQALLGSSGRLAERAAAADSGLAPIVVVKRGSEGATVACRVDSVAETLRFDVATKPIAATDTTGAGDAFDAGFIAGWLAALAAGRSLTLGLRQAAVAGHRVAARQLAARRPELPLR